MTAALLQRSLPKNAKGVNVSSTKPEFRLDLHECITRGCPFPKILEAQDQGFRAWSAASRPWQRALPTRIPTSSISSGGLGTLGRFEFMLGL